MKPEEIINEFNHGGIMIRTLQEKFAKFEFTNCSINIYEALFIANKVGFGGLRKWTLAQSDLLPNYYKMGEEVGGMGRYIAIIALPSLLDKCVVGIHEKDNFSGNVQRNMQFMSKITQESEFKKLLTNLKREQSTRSVPLENNETQTVGITPRALVGFIYYPTSGINVPRDWKSAKGKFENIIKEVCKTDSTFINIDFHVFTYKVDNKKTKLIYLDTLQENKIINRPQLFRSHSI